MTERRVDPVRPLAFAGVALAILGSLASLLPAARVAIPPVLALGVGLVAAAAWTLGRGHAPRYKGTEDDHGRFQRELAIHGSSILLTVVFLLLALVESLAIPAAFGQLVVFGEFALAFISLYPFLIATLLTAIAYVVVVARRTPAMPPLRPEARRRALALLAATGVFLAGGLAVGLGLLEGLGVRSERSVFVLAAALVTQFFFVRIWLRLPTYGEVTDWLEREERLKSTDILRNIVYTMAGISVTFLVITLLATFGIFPPGTAIVGAGLAMLALMGATFNVGVSHVVPELEMGLENAQEQRKIRRVLLNTASLVLVGLTLAVGTLTFLAFLAQVAGVAFLKFLLDAFVGYYPFIFALTLIPVVGIVLLRTRVKTEVSYSDQLKAQALGFSTVAIILIFFGVFIGSGFAAGTGIQIENAVLVMGAAVLGIVQFVRARALLPGVLQMLREAVRTSEQADHDTQESLKRRMIVTYVVALLFVLSFAGYYTAASLGVVEGPASSLGTDVVFFVYLLGGIGLLILVALRYFQGVNIDPAWAKRKKQDIGKRRLTSAQVTRYLILGFSIGGAGAIFLVGVLIQVGAITALGPLAVGKKYATDFFVAAILLGLGPYGWYHRREAARIDAINAKFPEFLRDLAESQRSGMTLTEAVVTASKGNYGLLSEEIRKMAVQIEWGVSFQDALQRFAKRVDTDLIKRTVSLVVQASNAGGNVVDVLTAAADDAREIQQIVKERKQSMSIYVMIIYIAFAVFIGVIAVLNAQFIPEVAKAVSKADGVSIGGLNFRAFDEEEFKTLFFHAAIIQGFGGGLVAGVMSGGKPIHGLRHSFTLVLIGWVLFRVVIG